MSRASSFFACVSISALVVLAGCASNGVPGPGPGGDGGECMNLCAEGETVCAAGGPQQCGDFDSDACLEWSPPSACSGDTTCVDGECVPGGGCEDRCTAGSVRCTADGTAVEACETDPATDCLDWAEPVDCPADRTCSGGRCVAPEDCSDECAEGSRQCSGDGFQTCADTDADPCLDWGEVTACPDGETCSGGSCSGSCTNECTEGALKCASGGDGFRECGNFDADSCLEWGAVSPCPDGETCSSGGCAATCEDECSEAGATQCDAAGAGVRECGDTDSDDCLDLGPIVDCGDGEVCQVDEATGEAACVATCDCDFYAGVCEPDAPDSTTACACDPDCADGGEPCVEDGHCDSWCPAEADPDCGCTCDYNPYCEAVSSGSTDTCECDPSCDLDETACSDDAHCDTFCPDGTDPDCGRADPCEERWITIGSIEGNQLTLSGEYADPDPDEGEPWIVLSQIGLSTGRAQMDVKMAQNELSCVNAIRVEAYGYDNSGTDSCADFGLADGGEIYIYNYEDDRFELLPNPIDSNAGEWHGNDVTELVSKYLRCPTDDDYCYVRTKVEASGLDCTHLRTVRVQVFLSP